MIHKLSSALVLVVLSNFLLAKAQDELFTFDDIRSFLETENGLISTTIHFRHCQAEDIDLEDAHLHLVENFEQWLYFDYGNGTEKFRTTKYFINDQQTFEFIIIEAFSDQPTRVQIQEIDPITFGVLNQYLFFCNISEAAYFFANGRGAESTSLTQYDDLKTALMEGNPVFTQSEVSACEGEDLGFAKLINARSVLTTWEINNNGLPNETLIMQFDLWVDYYLSTSPVGIETITMTVHPDGTILYMPTIFDFITWEDGFTTPEVGFQCALGTSVRVFKRTAAPDLTTADSFESLVDILQNGHRFQVMVDSKECQWGSPDGAAYPTIFTQTISAWSLNNDAEGLSVNFADKLVGKRDGKGYPLQQQYKVTEDGSLQVTLHQIDPLAGELIYQDTGICQLGSAAIIRSVVRPRNLLLTLEDLVEAQFQGRKVSFYADLNDCTGEPKLILGGDFVDGSFIDPHANNGTFYAPVTQVVKEVAEDGTEYFAWVSANVYYFAETNSFIVQSTVFESGTWEPTMVGMWECQMNPSTAYLYW